MRSVRDRRRAVRRPDRGVRERLPELTTDANSWHGAAGGRAHRAHDNQPGGLGSDARPSRGRPRPSSTVEAFAVSSAPMKWRPRSRRRDRDAGAGVTPSNPPLVDVDEPLAEVHHGCAARRPLAVVVGARSRPGVYADHKPRPKKGFRTTFVGCRKPGAPDRGAPRAPMMG
jgi:hypothetical protein